MYCHRVAVACLALAMSTPASAGSAGPGTIAQFFTYRLKDDVRFREGYRKHLGWHERHADRLVWYAWTVQSGPRKGLFVDGTAGTTFAQLDARPDMKGDGQDFAATAGQFAEAVDVETWEMMTGPSTANPLENRKPLPYLDVFLLDVAPGASTRLERVLARLSVKRNAGIPITWYRKSRGGGGVEGYMVILSRSNWSAMDGAGATLPEMLAKAYGSAPQAIASLMTGVRGVLTETWVYEPRMALIPGESLAD